MKKLILTVICGCMATFALAQTLSGTATVKGIVTDSAKNALLGYITIAIKDAATQSR
ncbi:hypothetical protein [Mucilaginibacter lacusdianchii]|uniref:hypothetical protein n=1 Tax=Mucilaginibacter lacusdianchii TaxID=2684211 RepID=UPI00131C7711|nr:hypothetical protein [Mucilaginibacter sp. JXJ CY 39]